MKNKNIQSVVSTFEAMTKNIKPEIINCDNGSEFISNQFKQLAKERGISIRYVPVEDHHKLGVIDRFIRTLRGLINKYYTMYKTSKYINVLPKLIINYNNSYHNGIKSIPNEFDANYLDKQNMEKYNLAKKEEIIFNIGDYVRLNTNEIGEIIYINSRHISQPLVKVGNKYLDLTIDTKIKILELI